MKIQSNSRQIPSNEKYTANKQYSDILYGYLQHISNLDEKIQTRYILKTDIKFSELADKLGCTRQTVSKKFNSLVEQGLLIYDNAGKRYLITVLESELATLLPDETVRVLCNTLQDRCLSILAYLLKTYVQHGEESCEINFDIIKHYVGLNIQNRGSNNQIIKDIFIILKKLGLIEYHNEKRLDVQTGCYKTRYYLDKVDNKVTFIEQFSILLKICKC